MTYSITINRAWLKRQLEAGNIEAKPAQRLTDDYAYDAATNFGVTDWAPARIGKYEDWKEGYHNIAEYQLRGHISAYMTQDGIIHLNFGGTHSELRQKNLNKTTPKIKKFLEENFEIQTT